MSIDVIPLEINGRTIGAGCPVYVIAELSGNHGQDFDRAVEMVKAAKAAGADAVKIQTYRPDTMTLDSDRDEFRLSSGTIWAGESLYGLYGKAFTPWEWHADLRQVAEEVKVDFFSSPFDISAVDYLESMEVPAYKVASFEVVDLELIRYASGKGKPVIISTGMATVSEIDDAVRTARAAGAAGVALLRCSSSYPAVAHDMNLRTIPHMVDLWHLPVGLSDHTLGVASAVTAVALGACLVEKHFTLSRAMPGPDTAFSLEPQEFAAMVEAVREAELALGQVRYGPTESERPSLVFRRSLFFTADVAQGEELTRDNVKVIRPGYGAPPKMLELVLGRRAARDVERGTPVSWELID